jgi:protein disulfide-isomerase-like protein
MMASARPPPLLDVRTVRPLRAGALLALCCLLGGVCAAETAAAAAGAAAVSADAATAAAAAADAVASSGPVTSLDTANFAAFVSQSTHVPVVVEFFAPWCGHCKALAPTYEHVAREVGERVLFGKVDATAHRDLASAHGVRGYPTIVWFKGGAEHFRQYRGPQTLAGLRDLATAITSDAVAALKSEEALAEFKAAHPVSFVLLANSDVDGQDAKAAVEAFTFACASLQDVAKCAAIGLLPPEAVPDGLTISVARFESSTVAAAEGREEGAAASDAAAVVVAPIVLPLDGTVPLARDQLPEIIKKWMEQFYLPLVTEVSGVNFGQVTRAGRVSVFAICADAASAAAMRSDVLLPVVHPVTAKPEIRDVLPRFNFGTFVIDDERAERFVEKFGITKASAPQLVGLDYATDVFYHSAAAYEVGAACLPACLRARVRAWVLRAFAACIACHGL